MEFSWQKYWSELPFPTPGDLPNPGIECVSPALTGFFTTASPGKPTVEYYSAIKKKMPFAATTKDSAYESRLTVYNKTVKQDSLKRVLLAILTGLKPRFCKALPLELRIPMRYLEAELEPIPLHRCFSNDREKPEHTFQHT